MSVAAAVRVISMEEDGRLGNLLMEMATLLLLGEHANVTVSLLPQVHPYWHSISAFFFMKPIFGMEKWRLEDAVMLRKFCGWWKEHPKKLLLGVLEMHFGVKSSLRIENKELLQS